jgi:prepilin-type N-terminal cleavage/methylation domain-containing protein
MQRGFSLIELAIGLMILGLVTLGAVVSMTQQAEQRRFVQARTQIDTAREAILAFVTSNGRLPCPATSSSTGQEAIASSAGGITTCALEAGFLPAVTLGLPELDENGLINNPWNDGASGAGTRPRALRYALTSLNGTVANALSSPGLGAPTSTTRRSDVQAAINAGQGWFICASASGVGAGANRCGTTTNLLSASSAAAIWTLGANGNDPSLYSADEAQNANVAIARVLVSRGIAPQGASGGMFDDLVTWLPYSLIADRLFIAGFVL